MADPELRTAGSIHDESIRAVFLSPELAGNPRFQAIVDRMGFPQSAK